MFMLPLETFRLLSIYSKLLDKFGTSVEPGCVVMLEQVYNNIVGVAM